MSHRCEHGKDSDVCVQCWEEKNLEPRISVATPNTELQKAVEYLENAKRAGILPERLTAAAKQLQQVEKERDEWKAKAEELEGRIANALL